MSVISIRAAFAAAAVLAASTSAQALVFDQVEIRSALAGNSTGATPLQVAELQAFTFGGVNVALDANGGSASALSVYYAYSLGPENAIDGQTAGLLNVDDFYHSNGEGPEEYLLVSFDAAYDIAALTIYGRGDCCSDRDAYKYSLLLNGEVVGSGTLDARETRVDTVTFAAPADVPAPAALGLLGFGLGALGLRRRAR